MASESVMDSDTSTGSAGLTYRLLAAWLFGLLYGIGLFLPILALIGLSVAAVVNLGSLPASGWILFGGILALLSVSIGPALMSRIMTRSWRRALPTALLADAAGVTALVAFYWAWGVVPIDEIISSDPGSFLAVLVALSAAAAIATIVMRAGRSQDRDWSGLGIGLMLGLGLALAHSLLVAPRILQGDNALHITWQVPPTMWVSVVFFSRRSGRPYPRRGLFVWAALELVSLATPLFSVPLLKAVGLWF